MLERVLTQDAALAEMDQRLRKAIDAQMNKAAEGDLAAIQFIAERHEGRPAQAVTLAGDSENPLVARIERVIVKSDNSK